MPLGPSPRITQPIFSFDTGLVHSWHESCVRDGKLIYERRGDSLKLYITPQPFVNVLPDEKGLFNIPVRCNYIPSEERYRIYDRKTKTWEEVDIKLLGCELYNNTGFCRHTASKERRKRNKQISRYNEYKKKLRALAEAAGVTLQVAGWSIYFFVPIAKSLSKKKRQSLHGQHMTLRPDRDNYEKAFQDALGKKRKEVSDRLDDKIMAQLSGVGKFWIDAEEGYIEILFNQPVYNPFNVKFINQ